MRRLRVRSPFAPLDGAGEQGKGVTSFFPPIGSPMMMPWPEMLLQRCCVRCSSRRGLDGRRPCKHMCISVTRALADVGLASIAKHKAEELPTVGREGMRGGARDWLAYHVSRLRHLRSPHVQCLPLFSAHDHVTRALATAQHFVPNLAFLMPRSDMVLSCSVLFRPTLDHVTPASVRAGEIGTVLP